jgi:hypothetical protein
MSSMTSSKADPNASISWGRRHQDSIDAVNLTSRTQIDQT